MKAAIEILTERMNSQMELAKMSRFPNVRALHLDNCLHLKYAIDILQQAESRQADLPPCPCCGSEKTYLTEAMHCTRCAVTMEI